ncbi:hypothetical protein DV735_g3680, partial [Chaetothyriales sp. CBS 134920]
MASLAVVLGLGLGLLVSLASAQAPQDPLKDLCRRYGHQTAIIDRKLYIDGGWEYANPMSQNPVPAINQKLIYSDLDHAALGMPAQYSNVTKNSSVPYVSGGILWADEVNKVFWLYGGEFSGAPSTFQLWGYDTILDQWNGSMAGQIGGSPIQRVSYGAGTTIGGRGYYYGGYLNSNTNPLWSGEPWATSTMVVLDLDSGDLSNNTGYDSIGRAEGVMVAIPASAAGILVYFGGVSFPSGNWTEEVAMDMSQILLYEIADNKWYTQTATGDIPANRRKFCAGATWAQDQSSYNIYLYGGFGFGENVTGFDDVYILTLPTFKWIKWYPDEPGASAPHGLLSCNVVDMGQMIVMGGNFTTTTDCDVPAVGGQHNLNLGQNNVNNAKWYQYLPNLTEYSVPPAIVSIAGGSADGGATNITPAGGFSDGALSVYFGQRAEFGVRTPTRHIPDPTGTSTPGEGNSNIAAIAGGTVGGVGGIALISGVLIWWCCVQKRQRSPKGGEPQEQQQPELQYGGGGSAVSWQQALTTPSGLQVGPNQEGKNLPGYSYANQQWYASPPAPSPPQQQQFFPPSPPGAAAVPYPQQQYYYYTGGPPFPAPSEMQGIPTTPVAISTPPPPPSLPHEMPARGMTPGFNHDEEEDMSRSGGDNRPRTHSSQSPTLSSFQR